MLVRSATASIYLHTKARKDERRTRNKNKNNNNSNKDNHYNNINNKKDHLDSKKRIEIFHKSVQGGGCKFQSSLDLGSGFPASRKSSREFKLPRKGGGREEEEEESRGRCLLVGVSQLSSVLGSGQIFDTKDSEGIFPLLRKRWNDSASKGSFRPLDILLKPSGESHQTRGLYSTSPLWSQLGSKVTSRSDRCGRPDHWNLHDRTLEWLNSGCWRPEFLRDKDLVESLRESGALGREWLESEWQRAKDNIDMPLAPIGDWLGIGTNIKDGLEIIKPAAPRVRRQCVPAVVVYDTGLCTREEDDPAHAVLFFRPCHTPTHARVSLAGQLAGVVHFCRHAFATPTAIRTKHAHVALKDYGRFVLMVCGRGGAWASGRLGEVTRLLNSATGGLQHLWHTCAHDHNAFTHRLTEVLDAILPVAIPDVDLGPGEEATGSPSSSTPSTASPATEVSEGVGGLGDPGKREEEEEEALKRLHRIFNTAPSLQLPKSGGAVFLRAQQVVEACQQQRGVLAGATMHKHRILNTQMPSELTNVLAALPLHSNKQEEGEVLQERQVEYALPSGVHLSTIHLPSHCHATLLRHQPKCIGRRGDRCGLQAEANSLALSSFRSVLQSRQALHAYPSSLPTTIPAPRVPQEPIYTHQPPSLPSCQPPHGRSLLAKISGGIAAELRPTQSLPGSPRKIRVTATHPDVGGNSPDLRYKVLTGRKPRPPSSTNSSPRRLPGGRTGVVRTNDLSHTSTGRRVAGLCPPSLTRGDRRTTPTTDNRLITKLGYDSEKSESGFEDGVLSDTEVSLKNTKNRMNLHLAPDKINAPDPHIPLLDSTDPSDEPKITREINGSHKESGEEDAEAEEEELSLNGNQREESDRSEDSDISVLDLAKFIETKENGDRQLAEAVRGLVELTTTRSDEGADEELTQSDDQPTHNHIEDTSVCESHGCQAVAVYSQHHHDTSLLLLLAPAAAASPQVIYTLWRLGVSGLEDVQQAVERALEVSEAGECGDSFLQWSPAALMAYSPAALNMHLIDTAHQDFKMHRGLMEVTLRSDEAVTWSHRHSCTETFYQVNAMPRPGLPIPSDVMAKVPHRAKRRLDRDHNITLL